MLYSHPKYLLFKDIISECSPSLKGDHWKENAFQD